VTMALSSLFVESAICGPELCHVGSATAAANGVHIGVATEIENSLIASLVVADVVFVGIAHGFGVERSCPVGCEVVVDLILFFVALIVFTVVDFRSCVR